MFKKVTIFIMGTRRYHVIHESGQLVVKYKNRIIGTVKRAEAPGKYLATMFLDSTLPTERKFQSEQINDMEGLIYVTRMFQPYAEDLDALQSMWDVDYTDALADNRHQTYTYKERV